MLFSYLSSTCLPLPLLLPSSYSVVEHILLIMSVLGGAFSAHTCDSCHHSCLEITEGLGENGRKLLCNVCSTQPIGKFHPPPSLTFMHFCRFVIFWTLFVMVHAMNLIPFPLLPLFLPPPSIFHIIIWMGGLPALNVGSSSYPLSCCTPPHPLHISTIISPSVSTQLITSIILPYISSLVLPPPKILQIAPIASAVWYQVYYYLKYHERIGCKWRSSWVDYHLSSLRTLLHLVLSFDQFPPLGQYLWLSRVIATLHPGWCRDTSLYLFCAQESSPQFGDLQFGDWLLGWNYMCWHLSTRFGCVW